MDDPLWHLLCSYVDYYLMGLSNELTLKIIVSLVRNLISMSLLSRMVPVKKETKAYSFDLINLYELLSCFDQVCQNWRA